MRNFFCILKVTDDFCTNPHPDPLVRGTIARIRIRIRIRITMSLIRNTVKLGSCPSKPVLDNFFTRLILVLWIWRIFIRIHNLSDNFKTRASVTLKY
jgi:hypothetical protein